ncbi:MAG: tRNA lysidine(34) synthetase TilS [Sphingomonadaceae bacterium]
MPTRNVLADAPARFAADVAAVTGGALNGRFGVAISGGPDSLALLLLAHAAFGDRAEAATVDHGLRAASAGEAAQVAEMCARRGIRHETLTIQGLKRGNLSAAARAARYRALGQWIEARGIDWLMTGHHADDQLETLMMRLNRASGVGGLAGIRRRSGRLIRPLLAWRRAELQAIVDAAGERAIDDPTNRDDRFDRARLRKALADAEWIDPVSVARSTAALADADDALDWTIALLRAARLAQDGATWIYNARGLPAELRRRALADCVQRLNPGLAPRGAALDRVLAALATGKTATIGTLRCAGTDDRWTFASLPPRRPTR